MGSEMCIRDSGGSYALSPNRKITGNVFYEQAESDGVRNLGTLGGQNVAGALSDMNLTVVKLDYANILLRVVEAG